MRSSPAKDRMRSDLLARYPSVYTVKAGTPAQRAMERGKAEMFERNRAAAKQRDKAR